MKSSSSPWVAATTLLAAIAIPAGLAAQEHLQTPQHHHYKLIDMGTLGGFPSAINLAGDVNGRAVNNRGTTIGFSATAAPRLSISDPIICGGDDGIGSNITHAFEWRNGRLTDLGALPPIETNCSNAYQLNASGEIAGFSENGQFDPETGTTQSRAVHWKTGAIEDLGSFGGNQNEALAINNQGQIVGFSLNTIPDPFSAFDIILNVVFTGNPITGSGTQTRAALWDHGQMQDLGTLGGDDAVAFYINDRGQIAGYSYTSTVPDPTTGVPPQDPFLWEKGKMIDLGTLGGVWGAPLGLNNRGQVIGLSAVAANPAACFFIEQDPNCHAFLWDRGKLIDLTSSSVGGNPITADGLNEAGQIVGLANFSSSGGSPDDAYLWQNGKATDLGALAGDCFSRALAINSSGQIVGNSFSCDSGDFDRAFLWEHGSLIDLNTLIPPSASLQLVGANAINDRGEIAGEGVLPGLDPQNVATTGEGVHAFLLIPCDESHPYIAGCDYSLADAGVTRLVQGEKLPLIPYTSLSPAVVKRLMHSAGVGPAAWRAGSSLRSTHLESTRATTSQLGDVITGVTLTASPTTLTAGQSVALQAIVRSNGKEVIGATVTFSDGSKTLGTSVTRLSPPGEAVLVTSTLGRGTHNITAASNGDTSAAVTVTVNGVATTTTLSASPAAITTGQSVTLTASVTGDQPMGTVSFNDGNMKIGTGTLAAGVASLSVSSLDLGIHGITAAYAGDASNNPSTSAAASVTVNSSQSGGGGAASLIDVLASMLALTWRLARCNCRLASLPLASLPPRIPRRAP